MHHFNRKFLCLTVLCAIALPVLAQDAKPAVRKAPPSAAVTPAYLQEIWDGWGTLDAAHQAQYYAQGSPRVFFDIAPLKYNSWSEYQKGVTEELKVYKSAKFTVKDVTMHPAGPDYWGTALVDSVLTRKDGKDDVMTFRWTFIFSKEHGKWLLVHEHVSAPLP